MTTTTRTLIGVAMADALVAAPFQVLAKSVPVPADVSPPMDKIIGIDPDPANWSRPTAH